MTRTPETRTRAISVNAGLQGRARGRRFESRARRLSATTERRRVRARPVLSALRGASARWPAAEVVERGHDAAQLLCV